ncbi:unnamed protein product, partial [Didymodactylos carnosus]
MKLSYARALSWKAKRN